MAEETGNYLSEVVSSLRELLDRIEEGISSGKFPEVTRSYMEHLGRNIRYTLRVIDIVGRENTIQSPLSPSSRGAMYNLRRAFYAVLGRLIKEQGVDREKSVASWKEAASKLVEFLNREGISEAPSKIVLTYDIVEEDEVKYMKIRKAEILYFELEGVKTLEF